MKILFVASEVRPFVSSGGLADVAGALPGALCKKGIDCRVVLPLYGSIDQSFREKMKFVRAFDVQLSWRSQYCGVFQYDLDGVTYYFLDNEYYFKRNGLYGFYDDAERFAFFSKAVLDMVTKGDFAPDLIHCNDWQTAMLPVYLNTFYRRNEKLTRTRILFTIHNIQYQGQYGMQMMYDVLGLPESKSGTMEYDGSLNMMKAAISQSDMVSTVSPSYAGEILDPWYSYGLDRYLRDQKYKLTGILNGIDTTTLNPKTDPALIAHYSKDNIEDKALNKKEIQRIMKIDQDPDMFLVGMVTRLVAPKGLDLVKYILDEMMTQYEDFSLVMLGTGDPFYENFFKEAQSRWPGRVGVRIGFVPDIAAKIYAGADAFLMPSKTEPCGLAQMVSLRYGTIPIVRETGGLKDSIKDLGEKGGNGFTFKSYNAHDMMGALLRCKALYEDRAAWKKAVLMALKQDFGWNASAEEYRSLYKRILG